MFLISRFWDQMTVIFQLSGFYCNHLGPCKSSELQRKKCGKRRFVARTFTPYRVYCQVFIALLKLLSALHMDSGFRCYHGFIIVVLGILVIATTIMITIIFVIVIIILAW